MTTTTRRGLPRDTEAGTGKSGAKRFALRGWRLRATLSLVLVVALYVVATLPLSTWRGVDFDVTRNTLPAYVKVLDFIDRDVHYERLAAEIVAGVSTEEAKLRAVFDWTRANIRDTPAGVPIVDDHTWHVIIRGHGLDDQKSDVFTTLLTYAGVPAYWVFIGPKPELPLSLVQLSGRWRVVDVPNGVMFKNRDGQYATVEEVAADRMIVRRQGPPSYQGLPYAKYFEGFREFPPPDLTHPQAQMLAPRVWFEMRKLVGRDVREWNMRPLATPPARTR